MDSVIKAGKLEYADFKHRQWKWTENTINHENSALSDISLPAQAICAHVPTFVFIILTPLAQSLLVGFKAETAVA